MIGLWYAILAFTLTMYLVLDGRNFGAGALHLFVTETRLERRQVIAAIGPLWSWHEVWLVAMGGVLFVAFPRVLATAFSGYYLALFLVLWSLIIRGIAIEVGGHIDNPLWQQFWDFFFALSSVLLALLFGVTLGNLARGVPLSGNDDIQLTLFTNFRTGGYTGVLDWYTLSMGLFFLILLCAHGATYLTTKTEGPVHDRSEELMHKLWPTAWIALIVITAETYYVRLSLMTDMPHHPLAWVAMIAVIVACASIFFGLRHRKHHLTFFGSWLFIAAFLGAGAAAMFPVMLSSTFGPQNDLTAYNSAASPNSLRTAIVWWPFAFALSCVYFIYILRKYRGKVKPLEDTQGYY